MTSRISFSLVSFDGAVSRPSAWLSMYLLVTRREMERLSDRTADRVLKALFEAVYASFAGGHFANGLDVG